MAILSCSQMELANSERWEEKPQVPQMVLEILSPSHTASRVLSEQVFYSQCGGLEMYFYEPESCDCWGFIRETPEHGFKLVTALNFPWVSPTLGIRFELFEGGLAVFYPNGDLFKDAEVILDERDRAFAKLRELGVDPEQL